MSFSFFERTLNDYVKINFKYSKLAAFIFFIASGVGLAFIGPFSDFLFPLLWISPVILIVSWQAMNNERHILSDLSDGRWSMVFASSVAALICGFFWEMWNYFSLAKWVYSVPFVHRLQIFEMPLLGYAGYLPFGLECAVIGDMIIKPRSEESS